MTSSILLSANHWLIAMQFSWWNPVRWVLSAAWISGWILGGAHSQSTAGALIGAMLASSALVFVCLFAVAEVIWGLILGRRGEGDAPEDVTTTLKQPR